MPSGAKKRKAAKKKKEQAAHTINSSTNNNPHGNGDPRSQDERESDSGSPASQGDHNHQHPFSHGEEEGKRGTSPIQSNVTDDKYAESTNVSGSDDVVAVKIEKELVSEEDHESTLVTVQHVEHDKSSSSSSSSRSSSDDESQASEKKSKEEDYNFGSQVTTGGNVDKPATVMSEEVVAVVKPVLSVPEEVVHAAEISTNNSVPDVVEPGLKESEGKTFSSSGTSTAENGTRVEKTQHFEPHDFSENQPLVASTPPVVQRTSVFSCCGLFDVFTGSGR